MASGLFVAGRIIEGVTEGLRVALPFLTQLSEQSLSANEILRQATAAGFEIRRAAGLNVIRQLRSIVTGQEYIKAVRNAFLPDPLRLPFAVTDIRRNYSFRVRLDGTDKDTGERTTFFVQVTSDNIMTKDQAYAQALGFLAQNAENYNFELDQATVVQAVRSPRLVR